jgi:pyruvate/2-oxoglutarate dehydrogenase complex dihydrolipoamide acyltransferase (E2) component
MSDPVASEKAAELARKESIDLADVKGTGAGGAIKVDDVRQAIADRDAAEKTGAEDGGGSSDSGAAADVDKPKGTKKAKSSPMPDRAHADGCPANPDRVEVYEQDVPPKKTSDGQIQEAGRVATMAHCCDCGRTIEL